MIFLKSFAGDQKGTSAIQYALVAGVLSLAVLAGSLSLRGSIVDLYEVVADNANDALAIQVAAAPVPDQGN